jgi:ABC-type Fe3+/spermidine/putrescine transport system ATPase subunit
MIKLENYSVQTSSQFELQIGCLEIHNPSRFIIVGPSGSGKTTLMKSLAGLHKNYQGTLQIDGQILSDCGLNSLYMHNIMFLSQDLGLWPHMSASEHISFVLSNRGELQSDAAECWLDSVGLNNKQHAKPHELSGGERKRLALARVLCAKPKYLFLDEPFANIDSVLAYELMGKIDREYEKQNFALIKVTHHYFGIDDEDTTIVVVIDGKIVQQGNWQQISQHPNKEWTKQWVKLATRDF